MRDTPATDAQWDQGSTPTELIGHVSVGHQSQYVSVRLTSVTGTPAARIVCGVAVLTGDALAMLPEVLALAAPCRVALTPTGQRHERARALEAHDVVLLREPQDLPDLDTRIREVAASAERMRAALERAGVLT